MKNKGFTLVEIMAVLVILGILLLVTVPSVLNSIDKKKNNEHNTIVEEIEEAAKLYVTQNSDVQKYLESNNPMTIDISYDTLVKEGLIKSNQQDPLTSEIWNSSSYVTITKEGKKLTAEYKEGTKEQKIIISSAYSEENSLEISFQENHFVDKLLEGISIVDETGKDYKNALIYKCQLNQTGDYSQENCREMKNYVGTHSVEYILKYGTSESEKASTKITVKIN